MPLQTGLKTVAADVAEVGVTMFAFFRAGGLNSSVSVDCDCWTLFHLRMRRLVEAWKMVVSSPINRKRHFGKGPRM